MSLHLDARQRAMLQEMGVHVWWPSPAPALADTPAPLPPTAPVPAAPLATRMPAPLAPPPRTPPAARPAPNRATPVAPVAPVATAPSPGTPLALALQAPQPLYPGADTPVSQPAPDAGWLIVTEGTGGADPLAGDAGRLLDNMLRALRLHHHPRVFLCALAPLAADTAPAAPCAEALVQAVATVQPAIVLVMGRMAARAVLGRSEPLGHLRAQVHAVAGVPTVVTYDAPYLLRAPGAKAGAWDDLCRAQTLAAPRVYSAASPSD
ncbi:MAG: uracil-DNA glycosylase family protein [Simplicispira sp.]|nr:uracil-DNA glycosylase family protein [Simplicispira sp.]